MVEIIIFGGASTSSPIIGAPNVGKSTFVNSSPQPRSQSFMTARGHPGTAPTKQGFWGDRTSGWSIPAVWSLTTNSECLPEIASKPTGHGRTAVAVLGDGQQGLQLPPISPSRMVARPERPVLPGSQQV